MAVPVDLHLSPFFILSALNGSLHYSFALQRFECGNVVELRNRILFDFYPELPHVHVCFHRLTVTDIQFDATVLFSPAVGSAGRVPSIQPSVGTTWVSTSAYMEYSRMISCMYTVHISVMNVRVCNLSIHTWSAT